MAKQPLVSTEAAVEHSDAGALFEGTVARQERGEGLESEGCSQKGKRATIDLNQCDLIDLDRESDQRSPRPQGHESEHSFSEAFSKIKAQSSKNPAWNAGRDRFAEVRKLRLCTRKPSTTFKFCQEMFIF